MKKIFSQFIKFAEDTRGVFLLMTFLLLIPIFAFVTFVIDGSGMEYDRAQLNRGLEQAGLVLTAENNDGRSIENPALANGVSKKQRNDQLIVDVLKSYYPQGSTPEAGDPEFYYRCEGNVQGSTEMRCGLVASFNRRSWLFWSKKNTYGATGSDKGYPMGFKETEKISSDVIKVRKYTSEDRTVLKLPKDIIFVLDVSGSMNWQSPGGGTRLQALKTAFTKLSSELLADGEDNRISIVLFTYDSLLKNRRVLVGDRLPTPLDILRVCDNAPHVISMLDKLDGTNASITNNNINCPFGVPNNNLSYTALDLPYQGAFHPTSWGWIYSNSTYKDLVSTNECNSTQLTEDTNCYDLNDLNAKMNALKADGGTGSINSFIVAVNMLLEKDPRVHKEKINKEKRIILMTDGLDNYANTPGNNYGIDYAGILRRFFNNGFCQAIRKRVSKMQDPLAKGYDPVYGNFKISFIKFGDPDQNQKDLWINQCLDSEKDYYYASNLDELLQSFQNAVSSTIHKSEITGSVIN